MGGVAAVLPHEGRDSAPGSGCRQPVGTVLPGVLLLLLSFKANGTAAQLTYSNCEETVGRFDAGSGAQNMPCPTLGKTYSVVPAGSKYLYACQNDGAVVCDGDGSSANTPCRSVGYLGCLSTTVTDVALTDAADAVYAACGDAVMRCDWNAAAGMATGCVKVSAAECPSSGQEHGVELRGLSILVLACVGSGTSNSGVLMCTLNPGGASIPPTPGCQRLGEQPCGRGVYTLSLDGAGGLAVTCSPFDSASYCTGFGSGPTGCAVLSGSKPCRSGGIPFGLAQLPSGRTAVSCAQNGYYLCGSAAPTLPPVPPPAGGPTTPPSPTPTEGPSQTPSVSPSAVPSAPPRATPSGNPSLPPTAAPVGPSPSPTAAPSGGPSVSPTDAPSGGPTTSPLPASAPSGGPSASPSVAPSGGPSASPAAVPSAGPSAPPVAPSAPPVAPSAPSVAPSAPPAAPSAAPSDSPQPPTAGPSAAPTLAPRKSPSAAPIAPGSPTASPALPTGAPSARPTAPPSAPPGGSPSPAPTSAPSAAPGPPSRPPSAPPTNAPTDAPAGAPTTAPLPGSATAPTEAPSKSPEGAPSLSPAAGVAPPTPLPSAPTGSPVQLPPGPPSWPPSERPSAPPGPGLPGAPTAPPTPPVPTLQPLPPPKAGPSPAPTSAPSGAPEPAPGPSGSPSGVPTGLPSPSPSVVPSSASPTLSPSRSATAPPSGGPSESPSGAPSAGAPPTAPPSAGPSEQALRCPGAAEPCAVQEQCLRPGCRGSVCVAEVKADSTGCSANGSAGRCVGGTCVLLAGAAPSKAGDAARLLPGNHTLPAYQLRGQAPLPVAVEATGDSFRDLGRGLSLLCGLWGDAAAAVWLNGTRSIVAANCVVHLISNSTLYLVFSPATSMVPSSTEAVTVTLRPALIETGRPVTVLAAHITLLEEQFGDRLLMDSMVPVVPGSGVLVVATRTCGGPEDAPPEETGEELGPMYNPLGLTMGSEAWSAYNGALVGDTLLFGGMGAGCFLLHMYIIVAVRHRAARQGKELPGAPRLMEAARFGCLIAPLTVLYPIWVMVAATVWEYGDSSRFRIYAGATLVFCAALPFFIWRSVRQAKAYAVCQDIELDPQCCRIPAEGWFFSGKAEWSPTREECWPEFRLTQLFFTSYTERDRYFLSADLLWTLVLSLLQAWRPQTDSNCELQAIICIVLLLGRTLYITCRKVYIAPFDNAIDITVGWMEVVSKVFLTMDDPEESGVLTDIAVGIGNVAGVALIVLVCLTLWSFLAGEYAHWVSLVGSRHPGRISRVGWFGIYWFFCWGVVDAIFEGHETQLLSFSQFEMMADAASSPAGTFAAPVSATLRVPDDKRGTGVLTPLSCPAATSPAAPSLLGDRSLTWTNQPPTPRTASTSGPTPGHRRSVRISAPPVLVRPPQRRLSRPGGPRGDAQAAGRAGPRRLVADVHI
eukprot:TRINITY_DN23485_c0_g2_i2.p1 TRINITY_DN23485_c0_g2~~TRINITY_DN23485_c0_g2_i2.p1  ORF type:complete len:1434 (+),score=201.13 TRINITY_DN23485_c0_g2_i2:101-4402(+)